MSITKTMLRLIITDMCLSLVEASNKFINDFKMGADSMSFLKNTLNVLASIRCAFNALDSITLGNQLQFLINKQSHSTT